MNTHTNTWRVIIATVGLFGPMIGPVSAEPVNLKVTRHVAQWLAKGYQPTVPPAAIQAQGHARLQGNRPTGHRQEVRLGPKRQGHVQQVAHRGGRPAPVLRQVCSTRACSELYGKNPVTRRLTVFQRIIQPRVHNHPAYIQTRATRQHPWVTVGRHPSIW